MSAFRGSVGFVAQGGVQDGSPQTDGAVAQGANQATLDGGGGGLTGVILEGDTFTVAGDAQVYTVTSDVVIGASTANEVTVEFTPGVQPSGGWDDNTAVTFSANSVAEVTRWEATPERPYINTTVLGDSARTGTLDIPEWSGSLRMLLDDADDQQSNLLNEVHENGAIQNLGAALVIEESPSKQVYGHIVATSAVVTAERGAMVEVEVSFNGEDAVAIDWNT